MFRLATENKFCFGRNRNRKRKEFSVSAKPNFGKNGRNSAESRNRICFGRTLVPYLRKTYKENARNVQIKVMKILCRT